MVLAVGIAAALMDSTTLAQDSTRPIRPTLRRRVPDISLSQARSAGLRVLESRHLTLITDLPESAAVDQLPRVFDAAVPIWAEYFNVGRARLVNWRMQGYLIGEREPFDRLRLIPPGLDLFVHGISLGRELWLYDQPSEYYRRHLLLHEGTHGFMATQLGSCGPGWYMEGMAELLGTHSWESGLLHLRYFPRQRSEVPMLGRIKLVQGAVAKGRALPLEAVLAVDNRERLSNESYAWCWALATFLDTHPRYQERFRRLQQIVKRPDFTEQFRRQFAADLRELETEWNVFVADLEYGHDVRSGVIQVRAGRPLARPTADVTIDSGRGWQSSGVMLEAGRTYRVSAEGRYRIRQDGDDWWSEPGGITIEYYRGRPLGQLLAALDTQRESATGAGNTDLTQVIPVGLSAVIAPEQDATLYLRINEPSGELRDNRGQLSVRIAAD